MHWEENESAREGMENQLRLPNCEEHNSEHDVGNEAYNRNTYRAELRPGNGCILIDLIDKQTFDLLAVQFPDSVAKLVQLLVYDAAEIKEGAGSPAQARKDNAQ